jgi:hypothetical protein
MTQAELLKTIQQASFDEIEEARLYAMVELQGVNFETVAEVTLAVQKHLEELREEQVGLEKLEAVAIQNKADMDAVLAQTKDKLNQTLEELTKTFDDSLTQPTPSTPAPAN